MIWWEGGERFRVGWLGPEPWWAELSARGRREYTHSGSQKGLEPERFKGKKYKFWYWRNHVLEHPRSVTVCHK